MEGVEECRRRADLAAVDPAMDRIWRGRGSLGGRREEGGRRGAGEGGREEGRGEATRGGEDEGESEEARAICVGGERRSIFASRYASKAKCLSCLRWLLEELSNAHSAEREAKKRLPRAVGLSHSDLYMHMSSEDGVITLFDVIFLVRKRVWHHAMRPLSLFGPSR